MNTARRVAAFSLFLSLGCVAAALAAQTGGVVINATVSPVMALHATGSPSLLHLQAPAAGGAVPSGGVDSTTYLLYTATAAAAGTHRITVALGAPLPAGVRLQLQATAPASNAVGALGSPAAPVALSTTPQSLITGIGPCYTGVSPGDGARLSYQLSVANWASYRAFAATSVTVTFTMTN